MLLLQYFVLLLLQYFVWQYIFVDVNVEIPETEVAATFLSVKHRVYS